MTGLYLGMAVWDDGGRIEYRGADREAEKAEVKSYITIRDRV